MAVGYLVGSVSATKVPIVGGGYGLAVVHDQERGTRTYLDITRFDLGASTAFLFGITKSWVRYLDRTDNYRVYYERKNYEH